MRAPSTIVGGPAANRPRIGVTYKVGIALAFAGAMAAVLLLTVRHAHGQLASAPWPMFHHDLAHTGLSEYDTSSNPGTLKWAFSGEGSIDSSPVVGADGTIYVGSENGNLYAVNPDGTQKWHLATGTSDRFSSPAIGIDGTIYVGTHYSLDAVRSDGTVKWSFATGYYVFSAPAIGTDGTIYFGSGDGNLYAVNPNGTEKWKSLTGSWIYSAPTVGADGTIYVGSGDNHLYALTDGGQGIVTQKWAFAIANPSSSAIGTDGTIYVGSGGGGIYALNSSGALKWQFATGAAVFATPALGDDGTIYFASYTSGLYAITDNGTKATEKWEFPGFFSYSAPVIGADGTIYICKDNGNLYAVSPDGAQKWTLPIGDGVFSSPAIDADGTIYISGSSTSLYAVGACPTCPTPTPTPTATPTATATRTPTPTASPTVIATVTATLSATPTVTVTGTSTVTPTQTSAAATPTATPTTAATATTTATATPTAQPTTSVSLLKSLFMGTSPLGATLTKNLTIKNLGHTLFFLNSFSSDDPAEFFPGASTCPPSGLSYLGTCTITVGFTPNAVGARSATLTLSDNAGTGSQSVALSGTGIADVTITKTVLTWGETKFRILYKGAFAVVNHQNTPVTLGESFSGPNAADFSVVGGTCGSTLAAKLSCTIVVGFRPGALGSESASLSVAASPDLQSPHVISLSTGDTIPISSVTPKLLLFRVPDTHAAWQTKYVTVTNKSPFTLPLSTAIIPTAEQDFFVDGGSCGGAVAGNSSCTIAVTYSPYFPGSGFATLAVTIDSDPTSPHNVDLEGTVI
jgi:outer membrane protein assembly factor BamB